MDVSEAADWFATTPLEGWNGTAWVADVALGDFQVYDRFITERTFGAKKRIFLQPEAHRLDTSLYRLVRTPEGTQWIVVADNMDISGVESYQNTLLLLEASYSADIIEFTTTTLASGQESNPVPSVVGTTVCDVDRFSIDRSDDFSTVVYGVVKVVVPGDITLDTDHELLIDGAYYEVQEVSRELLTNAARALRRAQ